MYLPFFRRLQKRGFTVVAYHTSVREWLTTHFDGMTTFISELVADSEQELDTRKDNLKEIVSFGVSAGSVPAVLLAKQNKIVTKLVLVTVYGSAVKQIYDEQKLHRARDISFDKNRPWQEYSDKAGMIEARNSLEKLQGKSIAIFASKDDKTILLNNTRLLLEGLERQKIPYYYHEGKGSHISIIVKSLSSMQVLDAVLS